MSRYTIIDDDMAELTVDTAWAKSSWQNTGWMPFGSETLHWIPSCAGWFLEVECPGKSIRRVSDEEAHDWLRQEGHETPRVLAEALGLEYEECQGTTWDDELVEKMLGGR